MKIGTQKRQLKKIGNKEGSCSRPPEGVLGMTPPNNFHICLSKCLLVLEYCKGITQFYLDSQLQLPIQKPAIFII